MLINLELHRNYRIDTAAGKVYYGSLEEFSQTILVLRNREGERISLGGKAIVSIIKLNGANHVHNDEYTVAASAIANGIASGVNVNAIMHALTSSNGAYELDAAIEAACNLNDLIEEFYIDKRTENGSLDSVNRH